MCSSASELCLFCRVSWRGQRALQELPASFQPSQLLWVTAHEWVRPQKGRKECSLEQWLGPSLCECQSLLCSRWGMLEYVLICQQCTWAAAHSGTRWWLLIHLVSQSLKVGSGLISHIQWYSYMNTYILAKARLLSLSLKSIGTSYIDTCLQKWDCANDSVQVVEWSGWRPLRAGHPLQTQRKFQEL